MPVLHHQIHSDDNNKPWLLLIHGLFGSLDNLSALRRLFSTDFQILSIDLPDHGQSDHSESFSFEHCASVTGQLLDSLKISSITVIGHSLGGKVAMQLALSRPKLVNKLVVLDIAPVKYEPRHDEVISGLNSVILSKLENRKQADENLQKSIEEPSTRQFLLKSLYKDQNEQWKWRFNLHLLQRDYQNLSAAIVSKIPFTKPVLFIKGGNSNYLLAEHKPEIIKLFPNSQLKIIGNTGHWLHAEKPLLCYKLACAFIQLDSKVI
ncbi:alpha/beta fold hydrolase [Paraglaciecola aquimarina]|uniref:Alpha/beta fold hydrolase n=1 Tax=Paraglaciecola algarum TaxID=3050085 RepID=A0ABS9D7T4_9ALTE|nr:alpha/beta fold hydrolase [Paraglaciecola sp. G1-23]MCF2949006.1 alpha/beta fold hydrolase [Paraglaciecola sp. G1-23]